MGPFYGGDRYELQFATMVDLIHIAYGVDPDRVLGGPSWLEMDRFDVIAKPPAHSTAESRQLMLRALLADRFKLAIHNDSKPMAAYKLTVAKTPKLQESDGSGETGCDFKIDRTGAQRQSPGPASPDSGPSAASPQVIALPVIAYTCHNTTMASLASALGSIPGAAQYFGDKPVVDQTELKGSWNFVLRFTPKVPPGINVTGEVTPLFDAIEKQLGLKIEEARVPMPVVVVDGANEKPTENSPDVAKAFPPPPTEFDVAEIKPSPPVRPGQVMQPEVKNGRLIVPGITLQNLIMLAWDIDNNDDLIGAPKWLDSDRFDIIAKAPAGVQIGDLSKVSSNAISINIEALRPMIRSLLVDRFKLVVHTEQRPQPAYTLVAVKPKLQKADPSRRTKWSEGPAPDSTKDPRKDNPVLGRLVTCQNVTMAQFAQLLPDIASGYVHNEVVDATGLQGGWDFTLSFSRIGALNGGGGRGGDTQAALGAESAASDPSGALSLLDALQRQLGLKLEMQKRPFPVVVIDHVEQKPTDN
jgi:uncharacterized protein (TIGR03435 family)